MAVTASATPKISIEYTLTQSDSNGVFTESTEIGYTSLSYADGTGTGQINIGAVATGYVSSGEEVIFDFQKFPKSIFDSEIILNFTSTQTSEVVDYPARGIKGILITNSWTSDILPTGADSISKWDSIGLIDRTGIPNSLLPRLNLHATGVESAVSGGFTDLFHGESGNIAIGPQCTWSQTHGTGVTPIYDASDSKYRTCLQLGTTNFTNISGSGGVTEEGIPVYYPIWDDNTDGNPWSGNLPRLSYELIVVGVTG